MSEPFQFRHRVSYAECTVGNHVYYSRYLDLFEAAHGGFFRSIGHPLSSLQSSDCIFPVLECNVRYHRPARYDDELTIKVQLVELTKVRLVFHHSIVNFSGELIAESRITHVVTDLNEKPKRLAQELLTVLVGHQKQDSK